MLRAFSSRSEKDKNVCYHPFYSDLYCISWANTIRQGKEIEKKRNYQNDHCLHVIYMIMNIETPPKMYRLI